MDTSWFHPHEKEKILSFSHELKITQYTAVAGCTILWYDWLITMNDEVHHIWPSKWSTTKIIFLGNRYMNLGLQLYMVLHFIGIFKTQSQKTCIYAVVGYGVGVFLSLASVHILVLTRAWVIWGRQTRITAILGATYSIYCLICIALIIYATITSANRFIFVFEGSCVLFIAPSLWYTWIASLCLEYISFSLTLTSIHKYYSGMQPGFRHLSPLPRKLVISALTFMGFSTVCHLTNMVMWGKFGIRAFNMIAVTFIYSLMSVAAQRYVLELRPVVTDILHNNGKGGV